MIEGNSLCGNVSPSFQTPYDIGIELLLEEIIRRESNGDPKICNTEYGCNAGMGLTGLIPSTVTYCEEKLGRKIDPFEPEQNLACARWLLKNEGIKHWEDWSGPYHLVNYGLDSL